MRERGLKTMPQALERGKSCFSDAELAAYRDGLIPQSGLYASCFTVSHCLGKKKEKSKHGRKKKKKEKAAQITNLRAQASLIWFIYVIKRVGMGLACYLQIRLNSHLQGVV